MTDWSPKGQSHQDTKPTNSLLRFNPPTPPRRKRRRCSGGGAAPHSRARRAPQGPSPKLTWGRCGGPRVGTGKAPNSGHHEAEEEAAEGGGTEEGMSWYGMIALMERSRVSGWQPCHAVCLMADGCVSPAVCRFPLMMVACHTTTTATATALRCALRVRVACIIRTCILHAYFWSKIHLRPTGHIIFMLSLFWHCQMWSPLALISLFHFLSKKKIHNILF